MPPKTLRQEEHLDYVQRKHYIGKFKVLLTQTKTHPEQRALDPDWVNSLAGEIGDPETLNRASYPIAAVLEDDTMVNQLLSALGNNGNTTPDLPTGVGVLVFAGQHRLAMLSKLALEDPAEKWWHADIYERDMESKYPAEFLTLMHASNVPDVKQPNRDVDLFRAVLKLKSLFEAQKISREIFLQNRQTLLGFKKSTSRAISNLTRNTTLAEAISEALSRPHIAKCFGAGPWKLLTTGRLYMVGAGLVREMTAQVDLLTEGMNEVPEQVLSFQGRHCYISHIESTIKGRKKHLWDVLPGGTAAALERVRVRPQSFVSTLNPRKADSWSLPDVVLLPSCLGSKVVEDELKVVHQVVLHLLKMTCHDAHFDRYTRSNPETLEEPTDHPAGMLAHVLQGAHEKSSKLPGYEDRILQAAWKERAELLQELKENGVPETEKATADDYKRLLENSQHWWSLLRLFKIHQFKSGLCLKVPKEFQQSAKEKADKLEVHQDGLFTKDTPASGESGSGPSKQAEEDSALVNTTRKNKKRAQLSGGTKTQDPRESKLKKRRVADQTGPDAQAGTQAEDENSIDDVELQSEGESDITQEWESDASRKGSVGKTIIRTGGDRRLQKSLGDVMTAAPGMTRGESRAITMILEGLLEAKEAGQMEELANKLAEKTKRSLGKIQQRRNSMYDTEEEQGEGSVHSQDKE